MDDVLGYFTALGLATAAGLNAWIPLLAVGLLGRFTDVLELTGGWDVLTDTPVLVALAVVAALDFVGDKVPAVDHVLHLAGTVVAPAAGVVAGLAATSDLDVSTGLLVAVGILSAEGAHGARLALRPVSTATTAGLGNPVLSLGEDAASAGLSVFAILVPIVALVLVIGLFAAAWAAFRRVRRRPPPPVAPGGA